MKRFLVLIFIFMFSVPVFAGEISALSREEIPVFFNNSPISFDSPPVIAEGRIIVPVRAIADALGADVSWDNKTKTAEISAENFSVSFTIGENIMFLNGDKREIDVPAQIIGNRTLVPLRALSEALGLNVLWEEDTKTVYLSKKLKDYLIPTTYYVSSEQFEGCVLACKTMVLSNNFNKPLTFAEVLEANGGDVYVNWGEEYCLGVSWDVILESEYEIKAEEEDFAFSEYTPEQKLEMIFSAVENSSGIIAQFSNGEKSHGVVITGYTSNGELIVCDPDTKSENPENTLMKDSCLAKMFDLYTELELLPYLISMRTVKS